MAPLGCLHGPGARCSTHSLQEGVMGALSYEYQMHGYVWRHIESTQEGRYVCSTCSLACLCMFISVCMPGYVSLCIHSEVCVFKFQVCIHLGCACSQHERGRQRDGGRGKERLRLIILPLAEESCCMPLPSALPSSGD